jgi:multiple sugar transport system permease protein
MSTNSLIVGPAEAGPLAQEEAPGRRARRRRSTSPGKVALQCLAGAVVALVFLFPYVIMFIGSLKGRFDVLAVPPTFFPKAWHPDNYIKMWSASQTPLLANLTSTLVIATGATLLMLVACIPAAYYTARFRFPGRGAFLFLVVVTQMLQPTLLATGLFQEFGALGLIDTWLAMILINAAFNLTFAIWILHSFFASVPREINEAAQIDGASNWTTLIKVNLPLVWPGIVTAVIYTFVASVSEFSASLVILTTDTNQTLPVALSKFVGQYDAAWQYLFGVSIVAIVPSVLLFTAIEKYLAGGLTAGSVK